MIQKDYIQRMIDALSKVIGKLMSLPVPEGLDLLNMTAQDYVKLDLNDFRLLSETEFMDILVREKAFHTNQLEFLAELFYQEGLLFQKAANFENARASFQKALLLFRYVDQHQGTFSMERIQKMQFLEDQASI